MEFYRRKWDAGLDANVCRMHVNGTKRLFRGTEVEGMTKTLEGARFLSSASHGKQMLFRFSRDAWVGLHLGMTGELSVEAAEFEPRRHDHLVLFQGRRALVFTDPRQFGRVLFHQGSSEPKWWHDLPPSILSTGFSVPYLRKQLSKHRSLPLKPALLHQETFPGVGNWMADEILWQARLHPRTKSGGLEERELRNLWRVTRQVCRRAIETIAAPSDRKDFGDPPRGFLFFVRWRPGGKCPRDGTSLRYETIGGRTTVWCPKCQPPVR